MTGNLKIIMFLFLVSLRAIYAQTEQPQKIHSHNDYLQKSPFFTAYESGCSSIEVDVFLKGGKLFATHSESEIIAGRTLEGLYLEPMRNAFALKSGRTHRLQLLIDIKSAAKETLQALITCLERYPGLISSDEIIFVVSGNRPPMETYPAYPSFIKFDYQSLDGLPDKALWEKVALISLDFHQTAAWDGMGSLPRETLDEIKTIIAKAHRFGKPFRFWGCPDTETAWKFFSDAGVDYINTDRPAACAMYFSNPH
jgi:alkaline phosphatase